MNDAELEYFDKKNKYGIMIVNGVRIGIGMSHFGKYRDFDPVYEYTVVLAPPWNISGRIRLHSKRLKTLVNIVRHHSYKLVKP